LFPQFLNLSHNKIHTLHERTFEDLNSLQVLQLDHNRLSHLPDKVFTPLRQLRSLQLHHNRLCRIDSNAFQGLNQLIQLSLAFNQLRFRPIDDAKSDSSLSFVHQPIVSSADSGSWHSSRSGPPLLSNCSSAPMLHLSLSVVRLPALQSLDLSANPLGLLSSSWSPFTMHSVRPPLGALQSLATPSKASASWSNLSVLLLNHSQLSFQDDASLSALIELRHLHLQSNLITVSPTL
jgi:Leucine-rich repeat (LRR) protein